MSKKNKTLVLKAGIGYTVGNYLLKGLSFFTIPLFSRLLSTEEYGIYNSYLAYEAVLYIILGLALHSSIKNAKYKYKDDFQKYISSCLLLLLMNAFIWLLFVNCFANILEKCTGFQRGILNLMIFHSLGGACIQFYNIYVGLDYRYKDFLKISLINAIVNILLSVILIGSICNNDHVQGRIVGTVVPIIIITMGIYIFFFGKAKPTINKEFWKYALTYSLPIVPHGISQVILSHFDRIMIKDLVGAAQAGIYSFSYNIFSIIMVTGTSLDSVWGPWFYEKMNEGDYHSVRKRASHFLMLMFVFSSLVMLISPELVWILGSSKYKDAAYTVIPVVAGGFFSFAYMIPSYVEYYFDKTKYIAIGTSSAALINVVLNWYFITKYGYVIAAYTTLVTYIMCFAFHYKISRKICKEYLISIKVLLGVSAGIVILNFIVLLFLDYVILRLAIAFLIGFVGLVGFWLTEKEGVLKK